MTCNTPSEIDDEIFSVFRSYWKHSSYAIKCIEFQYIKLLYYENPSERLGKLSCYTVGEI